MNTSLKFAVRASAVKERLAELGISQAQAARNIGYEDEAGRVYVRRVLNAMDTSNVVLDKIEEYLKRREGQTA